MSRAAMPRVISNRASNLIDFILIGIMPGSIDALLRHALRQHLYGNRPAIGATQREGPSEARPFSRCASRGWRSHQHVAPKKRHVCDRYAVARAGRGIPQDERRLRGARTFSRSVGIVAHETV